MFRGSPPSGSHKCLTCPVRGLDEICGDHARCATGLHQFARVVHFRSAIFDWSSDLPILTFITYRAPPHLVMAWSVCFHPHRLQGDTTNVSKFSACRTSGQSWPPKCSFFRSLFLSFTPTLRMVNSLCRSHGSINRAPRVSSPQRDL